MTAKLQTLRQALDQKLEYLGELIDAKQVPSSNLQYNIVNIYRQLKAENGLYKSAIEMDVEAPSLKDILVDAVTSNYKTTLAKLLGVNPEHVKITVDIKVDL